MGKISPSILSANFNRLGEEIKAVEAADADYIHIDVMDGQFVPNITVGPLVVKAARKITDLPLDVHLMIADPDRYIDDFVEAGSDIIVVHQEAACHLHRTLNYIKEKGKKAGVAINPSTPISSLECVLEYVEMVVLMSVNPGFGGQKFIESSIQKIEEMRKIIDKKGLNIELEIDGGVSLKNIGKIAAAGADVFVSGSGVYGSDDYTETIRLMKESIKSSKS